MLFSKLIQSVALTTVFAAGALADAASINAELQSLQKGAASFRDAINAYDGGYRTMLPVVTHTLRMSQGSSRARQAADKSEPIPESEAHSVVEESDKTKHAINEALEAAATKAELGDPNGFRELWGFGVKFLGKRYENAADSIQAKLPESSTARMQVPHDGMKDHFKAVEARFD